MLGRIVLPQSLQKITQILIQKGLTPVVVGGAVRDSILKLPIQNWDIEIYGEISLLDLIQELAPFGHCNTAGKLFGVLRMETLNVDFSLPRTEKKTGSGHHGFEVTLSGRFPYETAAARRDFTLNSMGFSLKDNKLIDPYHGLNDLQNHQLRHITPHFIEDPLRVLRGIQLAARFNFDMHPDTIRLCQKMSPEIKQLSRQKVVQEIKKWRDGKYPEKGWKTAIQTQALFPILAVLQRA